LRLFWVISAGVEVVELTQFIKNINSAGHVSQRTDAKRVVGYSVTVGFNVVLALMGLLGMIPSIGKHLEPRKDLAFRKPDNNKEDVIAEESAGVSATKLFWRHSVTRESIPWLVTGAILSCFRGYLLQQIYLYFGSVFSATSESNLDCQGAAPDNTAAIVDSIVKLVLIFSAYSILFGVAQFFWSTASEIIANGPNGVRNRLFQNMLAQEAGYIHQLSTGTLVSRFANDADRMKRTISDFVPQVLEFTAMVIAGLIFLFMMSWSITIYMITIVPLTYAVTYYQSEIFELYEARNMARIAGVTAKVQDVFSKFATVLIYGKQNTERSTVRSLVRLSYRIMRRKSGFAASIVTVSEFLSWSTTVLGTFLGTSLITVQQSNSLGGSNPLGRFVTYILFSINVIKGVVILLRTLPKIGETFGACAEILQMIEREPQGPEAAPTLGHHPDLNITKGEIVFKDVIFSYPTTGDEPAKIALDGINLTVKPNSKVAIVGDSGAGKSTILHLIARFYDTTKGAVLVDGQNIKDFNTDSLRKHMAIVSQDSDIFAMSILENIFYGVNLPGPDGGVQLIADTLQALKDGAPLPPAAVPILDKAMKAVDDANAGDFVRGQETKELGEDGKGLSGGQRQRLTISRALFKNPKILLLDEVTSALDAISEGVVQAAIDKLTSNRTVLIVAHRLHTIKNADKIIVMQKGRIVAEGNHDELMVKSERYRELVEAAEHGETKPAKPAEVQDELSAEIKALFKNVRRALRDYPALRRKYFKQMVKLYPQLKSTARKTILPAVSPSSLSDYGSDSDQDGIALSRVRTQRDYEGYSSSDVGSDSESSVGSLDSDSEGPSGSRTLPKASVGAYYLLNRQDEDMDPRITKLNRPKGGQ
jgi:ATP-binding cassette subfamily B protein